MRAITYLHNAGQSLVIYASQLAGETPTSTHTAAHVAMQWISAQINESSQSPH